MFVPAVHIDSGQKAKSFFLMPWRSISRAEALTQNQKLCHGSNQTFKLFRSVVCRRAVVAFSYLHTQPPARLAYPSKHALVRENAVLRLFFAHP